MFGLVEQKRECSIDMTTEEDLRPVLTSRAAPDPINDHNAGRTYDCAAPLRPHKLPPAILRDRSEFRSARCHCIVPSALGGHADFAVPLVGVAVIINQPVEVRVGDIQRGARAYAFVLETARKPVLPDLATLLRNARASSCDFASSQSSSLRSSGNLTPSAQVHLARGICGGLGTSRPTKFGRFCNCLFHSPLYITLLP